MPTVADGSMYNTTRLSGAEHSLSYAAIAWLSTDSIAWLSTTDTFPWLSTTDTCARMPPASGNMSYGPGFLSADAIARFSTDATFSWLSTTTDTVARMSNAF